MHTIAVIAVSGGVSGAFTLLGACLNSYLAGKQARRTENREDAIRQGNVSAARLRVCAELVAMRRPLDDMKTAQRPRSTYLDALRARSEWDSQRELLAGDPSYIRVKLAYEAAQLVDRFISPPGKFSEEAIKSAPNRPWQMGFVSLLTDAREEIERGIDATNDGTVISLTESLSRHNRSDAEDEPPSSDTP